MLKVHDKVSNLCQSPLYSLFPGRLIHSNTTEMNFSEKYLCVLYICSRYTSVVIMILFTSCSVTSIHRRSVAASL